MQGLNEGCENVKSSLITAASVSAAGGVLRISVFQVQRVCVQRAMVGDDPARTACGPAGLQLISEGKLMS